MDLGNAQELLQPEGSTAPFKKHRCSSLALKKPYGWLSKTFRALFAVFLVAIASLAGALYLARDHVAQADDAFLGAGSGVAALDLQRVLMQNPRTADQRMLDNAFRQVEKAYYKPVNAQVLLGGERSEIVRYLKAKHISAPAVPALLATGDEAQDVRSLNKDLEVAQNLYGRETSNAELTQAAIRGMLNALGDPYTTYLSPSEISSLEESLKGGDFGGIGVYIVEDPRTKVILVEPIEGTPADRAGVRTGDQIFAVDGKAVTGDKLDDVERLIRGPIGTKVHLLVRSHGSPARRLVAITRERIYVPSVHAKVENGYDYVRLTEFGQTSYDEVRKALLAGKASGAKGYILDLRNNGGGLLEAAVQISSLFIPDGAIVSTIDREGNKKTEVATHESIGAAPLVVLVNKYTASASEITAGAIQDYKVGALIGTKTFGKGVVQSIYNLSDGGALKITTARYVTPLGRDIHHKGVKPDVVIDQPVEAPIIDTPKDVQLNAAKAYLRRIARR